MEKKRPIDANSLIEHYINQKTLTIDDVARFPTMKVIDNGENIIPAVKALPVMTTRRKVGNEFVTVEFVNKADLMEVLGAE